VLVHAHASPRDTPAWAGGMTWRVADGCMLASQSASRYYACLRSISSELIAMGGGSCEHVTVTL
jgi:hypothetical protein